MKNVQIIKPPISKSIKCARVTLEPGEEIGEHVTDGCEEIIVVLKGRVILVKEGKCLMLEQGQAHFIGESIRHNVRNESEKEIEYVYVVSMLR